MCVNQNLKSISIVHVNNEASWCCLQCKCSSKNDITTRLCNFTKATIYIPVSASLRAAGKQEPSSDGHKPDNSIRQRLLQPQPSFLTQCRGCCCYIPCIMQLPACVQLLLHLHEQNEGSSRGWQGMAGAEICPGVSEQAQSLALARLEEPLGSDGDGSGTSLELQGLTAGHTSPSL